MKNYLILCGLLCCLVTACTPHGETGDKLRLERKWAEAAQEYQKGADNGDAYCMWRLAKAYGDGSGVEYCDSLALLWLNKAAESNSEEAKIDLIRSKIWGWYEQEKDTVAALKMLRDVECTTTNSYALSQIANIYWIGIGTALPQNKSKAVNILNSVPDKTDPMYLLQMGFVKFNGSENMEINELEAIDYWKKSYELGGLGAIQIANVYLYGCSGIEKNIEKAIEWYNNGIAVNGAQSMYELSLIYANESGDYAKYEDKEQAISLIKRSIELRNGNAADKLGCWYSSGFIVDQDDSKAFEYFQLADKYGSENGTLNLSVFYLTGNGGAEINREKAVDLWIKAANNGSAEAAFRISVNPEITGFSQEETNRYMLIAAKSGHPVACHNAAVMYYYGMNGLPKDEYESYAYAKKAVEAGNEDTRPLLDELSSKIGV